MYRDQDKSDSEGYDEETIDIEDGAETASESGDGMEYENSGNSNEAEIEDFEETTTGDSKNVCTDFFLRANFLVTIAMVHMFTKLRL